MKFPWSSHLPFQADWVKHFAGVGGGYLANV